MKRRPGLAVVLVLIVLAAGVAAVDVFVPQVEPPAPLSVPAAVSPTAGTWTCAVGDRRAGTELRVAAARTGTLGDEPATVDVGAFEEGEIRAVSVPQLFPGTHAATSVVGDDELGVFTRWSGGPVAVQREWRLHGDEDLPPGTVAGACPRAISDSWVVPGLITSGGSDARLRLANPFRTDATVAVGFLTPQGAEDPIALQNLTVPARGIREIQVNQVLPERDDLTAIVRVLSGRVAAEGYQLTRAAIGDVDGVSLLAAATAPAEVWTVPWVADDEDTGSWLWVANLGERPAPVELTLNTEDGGIVPEGLAEVTVAPGQVRRVDLRGTLPEGIGDAAVTVRSDGAPVYVSGATRVAADEVADTGFAVQLGSPVADTTWVVTGGDTVDRQESLRLVNPGSEAAEVEVVLFNGTTALRPGALQEIEVPPGSLRTVDVSEFLGDVGHWSAYVTAVGGEIVVGRLGSSTLPAEQPEPDPDPGADEDPATEPEPVEEDEEETEERVPARHLIATLGTPAAAWSPVGGGLAASAGRGTVQRLDTRLGIQRVDPLAPPEPDDPEPDPSEEPEPPPEGDTGP